MNDLMFPAKQHSKVAPWLQHLWEGLDFQQFPNAILLHGQSGIGKFAFAVELAKALLCESSPGSSKPCNQCEACHWFNTGNHPDFIALVPETHRKLLPQADYEADEVTKKGKVARDDSDSEPAEKKEKKNISSERASISEKVLHLEDTARVTEDPKAIEIKELEKKIFWLENNDA